MENILFHEADIEELAQRLTLGPQAGVLELIEDFNNRYISTNNDSYQLRTRAPQETKPIGITKKFSFKPGAYDTIKAIINAAQCFNMRAQSLTKVIERARNEGSWRLRNINTEINNIEVILITLRRNGIVMQDNSDDAIEAYQLLKNHLIEQYQNNNGSFNIRIEDIKNDNDELIDYNIWVNYTYKEPNISYKHTEGAEIGQIPFKGDVVIRVRYSLSKLINALISNKMDIKKLNVKSTQNNRRGVYTTGGYVVSDYALLHPFITTRGHWHDAQRSSHFRYVCFGNLENEISACLGSLDLISAKIFIDRLVSHYDTSTGPLNSITKAYHGIPHSIEDNGEFQDILPPNVSSKCGYYYILEDMPDDIIKTDSYCAKHCSYVNQCNAYKSFSIEISAEEKERNALEQATINAATRRI